MKPRRAGKLLWVSGLECLNARLDPFSYLPNPLLQLRTHSSEGPDWRPLFQVLNLPWMDAGTRRSESRMQKSLEILVERAKHRVTTGEDVPEVF